MANGHGGYRPGSGRAKTGYYKGIYCGSTYELMWVIYSIDNNIEFKRFDTFLEHDGIKYYPDFLIGKDIIEIKGYENQKSVNKKTAVANLHGYKVILLRKDDLQIQFDWVKNNYKFSNVEELYDDYTPKYTLICGVCGTTILTDLKRRLKKSINFCSRQCSGRSRIGKGNPEGINQYSKNKLPSSNG